MTMTARSEPVLSWKRSAVPRTTKGKAFSSGEAFLAEGMKVVLADIVEGPLNESWPPPSTRQLLGGTNLVSIGDSEVGPFDVELTKKPIEHVREIIGQFAPRAFRRPQTEDELESFVSLAVPTIEEGRDFFDALRIPLRSMLSSPEFMMFDGIGQHDGYALASRLFLLSVEKYARR